MIYFSVYDTSIMMGFVLLISSIVVENIWILHDESLWIACSVHTLVKKHTFEVEGIFWIRVTVMLDGELAFLVWWVRSEREMTDT